MRKFLEWLGLVGSTLSMVDRIALYVMWAWFVGVPTLTGVMAYMSPIYDKLGPLFPIAAGFGALFLASLTAWVFAHAVNIKATAELQKKLAAPSRRINPLARSFEDDIVDISELRLPGQQHHQHKTFRRCQIVGPGVITFQGQIQFVGDMAFRDMGSAIVLPIPASLSGPIVFDGCIFEDCVFHRITLLILPQIADVLRARGMHIAGDPVND